MLTQQDANKNKEKKNNFWLLKKEPTNFMEKGSKDSCSD
jgi:hypothetical protein